MFTSNGTLLLALLALPFAGSLAAALFPANARNREAWLAGAVALAVHGLAWTGGALCALLTFFDRAAGH
ncbi:MAG TPA: hypothetical protein VIG70_13545 [Burkholderiales bacterium]|jgi:hypothetical protein